MADDVMFRFRSRNSATLLSILLWILLLVGLLGILVLMIEGFFPSLFRLTFFYGNSPSFPRFLFIPLYGEETHHMADNNGSQFATRDIRTHDLVTGEELMITFFPRAGVVTIN